MATTHVVRPHPYRVRPTGSRLLTESPNLRDVSLGWLRLLSDELLLRVFSHLEARSLARLACASKALRVVACTEELWKALVLEQLPPSERLRYTAGTWRNTFLSRLGHAGSICPPPSSSDGLFYYSDVLYAPWHCGTASIPPNWHRGRETIERVHASCLSVEDFTKRFEAPGYPVILTGAMDGWPALHLWTESQLRERFGNGAEFHVGGHAMGLADFYDYCATNTDEQPLYLFDKKALVDEMAQEFTVPDYFAPSRDLFEALPQAYRPDHRWLIVGGTRSGSSWHIDPNATSAWNACVYGRKKWILCPPKKPPPGVDASEDGTNVTSPISLFEWFRVFYGSLAQMRKEAPPGATVALEATLGPGEILFVPSGWWHCCLNVEPSLAVTQNYAPRSWARPIWKYLQGGESKGDLVSGIAPELRPQMAGVFEDVLRRHCPEALQTTDEEEKDAAAAPHVVEELSKSLKQARKGLAAAVVAPDAANGDGVADFRFSF